MTPQQIELALETIALVLEDLKKTQEKQQATITALEEALKEHAMQEVQRLGQEIEQEQEPHGWYIDGYGAVIGTAEPKSVRVGEWLPWYTTPPQRKPLTDDLYNELLFAVGNKYPNETRHQTALRYILQAEKGDEKAAHGIKENT